MALNWKGRRVLVTGAAGFVGANLCRVLLDQGADLYGLDLVTDSPSLRVLDVKIPLWAADVADPVQVRGLLKDLISPEVVFHLAGKSHIAASQRDPLGAWEASVRGTWSVLEACRSSKQIRAVVCASSNHVYGDMANLYGWGPSGKITAFTEGMSLDQVDVYGTSKQIVDSLVRCYGKSLNFPVASLRHVNAFGPADPHQSHLVTGTICDLLDGKSPIIRGDGTATKGYLSIRNVVAAYLQVAQELALAHGVEWGSTWNAGPPEPISVLSLVNLIIKISGREVRPVLQGSDLSQNNYLEHLDSTRIRSLGWNPDPLSDGLREAFIWYEQHSGLKWLL